MLLRLPKLQVMQNLRHYSWTGFSAVLLACFFFMAHTAIAAEQLTSKQYYDAGSITLGGEDNEFTVGNGQAIKLTAGHSIHLLPGTHIEAGGQVVVEVRKDAKPEITEERPSVLSEPELLASPLLLSAESSFTPLPEHEQKIGNSSVYQAVLPVQTYSNAKNFPAKGTIIKLPLNYSGFSKGGSVEYLPVLA